MEQMEWIVINYTLPREPSRIRVSMWRKLKKIGAVNIQQSMWILPQTDENYDLLNKIKEDVSQNSGEAFVMKSSVDEDSNKIIMERFKEARNEEYREVIEQCDDFFKEIDKEIARENFTFAEIEENEEELNKLRKWHEKIVTRDFFEATLKEKSKETILKCAEVLEKFCEKVYDYNEKG
jgi:DNA-binding transcriptional regulator PaaX